VLEEMVVACPFDERDFVFVGLGRGWCFDKGGK